MATENDSYSQTKANSIPPTMTYFAKSLFENTLEKSEPADRSVPVSVLQSFGRLSEAHKAVKNDSLPHHRTYITTSGDGVHLTSTRHDNKSSAETHVLSLYNDGTAHHFSQQFNGGHQKTVSSKAFPRGANISRHLNSLIPQNELGI